MPKNPGRTFILIASACAIFWPGAFIFGYPGVMRQYWQQAFNVGGSEVGKSVFFVLIGAACFMYLCGRWQEKYGPAKLAALGAVLCGSSVIWLSRAGNMTDVYAWAFLVGASSAFIYVPGAFIQNRMAHIVHLYRLLFVIIFFNTQANGHTINAARNFSYPSRPPCPYLRADIIQDRDTMTFSSPGNMDIKIRIVDKNQKVGTIVF